jgi:hypothetical protein
MHMRSYQTSARRSTSKTKPQRESAHTAKHFSSLFISLLAVSPMAIEYDALSRGTVEATKEAPMRPTTQGKRAASGAEIRKLRWKRFRYEMGLKINSQRTMRGWGKRRRVNEGEMELQELLTERSGYL